LTYSERFEEALRYAARLHRAQMRKGTNIPYVTHLLAVAAIVGGDQGATSPCSQVPVGNSGKRCAL
jgi:(p)ppGpp synthase/HD superfamily hydrolase